MRDIYERLGEMNIQLPPVPQKGGVYSMMKVFQDSMLYTSGLGPNTSGGKKYQGKLGADVTIEEGKAAARATMLNLLSMLHEQLGDLNRIKQFVKIIVFVACTPDFYSQPEVANGATEMLAEIFGEECGLPARSAIAAPVLPGNIPVEIEMLIELKS